MRLFLISGFVFVSCVIGAGCASQPKNEISAECLDAERKPASAQACEVPTKKKSGEKLMMRGFRK